MVQSSYRPRQPFFEGSGEAYVSWEESERVQGIQFYSFVVSGDPAKDLVVVPDGTIDLVFHCSAPQPSAYVCGSVKKGTRPPFVQGGRYFGARFYPSAAEAILSCPLDEFTEREVSLVDLRPDTCDLVETICRSAPFPTQIALFQQFPWKNRQGSGAPEIVPYLLGEIHRSHGDLRIHELEEKSGYSARHIDNMFKKHVGIGPKFYSRIVRFQNTLRKIEAGVVEDFSQIAEEAGYYDQAHFINEFRTFCTKTPRQFSWAG